MQPSDPATEYRYPCENCGASLRFQPGDKMLVCDYCGHHQPIQSGMAKAPGHPTVNETPWGRAGALQWEAGRKARGLEEIPLAEGLRLDLSSDLTETVRTLSCPNCGAKIEITNTSHASECPFCATAVVTDTGTTRHIKPQGVLPFRYDQALAKKALDDWLGSLWFAPSGLVAYARRGRRMRGMYSPFWTFDARTQTTYTGQRGDYYYETRYVTREVNGRMQQVPVQVRHTQWRRASGRVARDFDDILVLATTSLPRKLTDGLVPWDLSQVTEYRPDFLAGFEAEGYTVALADGHVSARQEMARVIAGDVRRDIGGDEQMIETIDTRHHGETFKQILLPIWVAAYKYNGKSYRFVVNGQTGRVQGERPYSAWKIAFAVIVVMIATFIAMMVAQQSGMLDGRAPVGYGGGNYVIRGY